MKALMAGMALAALAVLYLLASRGDRLALSFLVVGGTVVLVGIGVVVALIIMNCVHRAEKERLDAVRDVMLLTQAQYQHEREMWERSLPWPQAVDARWRLDNSAREVVVYGEKNERKTP